MLLSTLELRRRTGSRGTGRAAARKGPAGRPRFAREVEDERSCCCRAVADADAVEGRAIPVSFSCSRSGAVSFHRQPAPTPNFWTLRVLGKESDPAGEGERNGTRAGARGAKGAGGSAALACNAARFRGAGEVVGPAKAPARGLTGERGGLRARDADAAATPAAVPARS